MKIFNTDIFNINKVGNRMRTNISKILNVPISLSDSSASSLIINLYKGNVIDTVISQNLEINII